MSVLLSVAIELLLVHSLLKCGTLVAEGGCGEMASKHISLPSAFVEGDPAEWFQRFDICCRANNWNDETKAKKLPTLLVGGTLAIWVELAEVEKASYQDSKGKLIARMAPVKFVSLEDFHTRRLRPGESLLVFLHKLKRLLDQAMPEAEAATRTQLVLHQFSTRPR